MTKLAGPNHPDDIVCAEGGLYAPTIRYHKGTFYIVCTNVIHTRDQAPDVSGQQNFILSTTNIWGDEWSDPVFYELNGIDPSLFWDDDGKVYAIGAAGQTPETKIHQFQIDLETGRKLSEVKMLWEGITKVFPEGPHMYKKDGWYYLLVAEGGCFADHHTIMARSRNIWGPYEPNPANPVLGKTGPKEYIQYTGHGDLFKSPSGQWYFVCLGVRKNHGRFIMGRESVLTTATWPKGEFPVIEQVQMEVPLIMDDTLSTNWHLPSESRRQHIAFVRIRDPVEDHYLYDGNAITLTASQSDLSDPEAPVTFTGKRQRHLNGSAAATMEPIDISAAQGSHLRTGLCYYKDEYRYVRVSLDVDSQEIVFELFNKARSLSRKTSHGVGRLSENAKITFSVDYTEVEMIFWFSIKTGDAVTKKEAGRIDTLDMTGHDFVGPIIGVYAVGDRDIKIQFSNFQIEVI